MPFENSQEIEPIELTSETRFTFRCHPGVSCFNECCAETTIILSPYDVLRLKRHLQLTAKEFLSRYTDQYTDDFSGLPLVVLNMAGEKKLCPFSTLAGCGVYEDRPATCRYYPVGVGSQWTETGVENCFVYISRGALSRFSRRRRMDAGRLGVGIKAWKLMSKWIGSGKPLCCRLGLEPGNH